jgi:hypothetical protein
VSAQFRVVHNDEIQVDYGDEPVVPDATYEAVFVRHGTFLVFGKQPSVWLRFRIVTPGEHFSKELVRWYRVASLRGNARPEGAFTLRRKSLLFLELVRLSDFKQKPSRVSLSVLRGRTFEVSTRKVKQSWDRQADLPDWLQYSVVDRIIRATTGQGT